MDTTTSDIPDTPNKSRMRTLLRAAAVCSLPAFLLGTAAAARADDDRDAVEVEVETFDCGLDLTQEEIAEIQADEDALDAYLDARTITHSWREPDAEGLRFVEWDDLDNAANAAVDAFWAERYPLTPADIEAYNAEADGLAAELEAKGIDHRVTTDGQVRTVEWDEDDATASDAVDAYFAALYPLTAEEIETINADADRLAAHLEEKDIDHEIVEETDGSRWVEWDDEDPAANAAVGEWYTSVAAADETASTVIC